MKSLGKRAFASHVEIEVVHSPIYGEMWAPSNLSEFNLVVERAVIQSGDTQGWRGQSRNWHLDSSAVRRLAGRVAVPPQGGQPGYVLKRDSPDVENQLRIYEGRLLEQAHVAGHHRREGREWSNLELLALLQHNGAATRMVDFTRNVFVSLWFACENDRHKNKFGLIVGTDLNSVRHHWLTYEETQWPLINILTSFPKTLLLYQPEALFERMRAQQGLFMFGDALPNPWGSLPAQHTGLDVDCFYGIPGPHNILNNTFEDLKTLDNSLSNDFKRIAVSPVLKNFIRIHGTQLLGYHTLSLFPDLAGFCRVHGANMHFDWEYFKVRP